MTVQKILATMTKNQIIEMQYDLSQKMRIKTGDFDRTGLCTKKQFFTKCNRDSKETNARDLVSYLKYV